MEFRTNEPKSLRDEIQEMKDLIKTSSDPEPKKVEWTYPKRWAKPMRTANKHSDKVLVFLLNLKGELEKPQVLPLRPGHRVLVKGKPYDAHPESFLTLEGRKCLLIKEIDRRPVCNLDWKEVKARGDLTESDDILLKTAMDAKIIPKMQMGKTVMIIGAIVLIGVLAFVFSSSS